MIEFAGEVEFELETKTKELCGDDATFKFKK